MKTRRTLTGSLAQLDCNDYHTPASKEVIQDNIERSPLYSGLVGKVGPAITPPFEDKVVKFSDRDRHHVSGAVWLDELQEFYASRPVYFYAGRCARALVKIVPGMEDAEIMRFAHAIDYLLPLRPPH